MMEAPDIECPNCRRLNFGWEAKRNCPDCRWVIRPDSVENPFGYDVLIEIRDRGLLVTQEKHYKGNEAKARSRAKAVRNFSRVLALVPLSEETFIRAYGDSTMKREQ
jgi:hypothetical protein